MYQADSKNAAAVINEMRGIFKNKLFDTVIPLDESAAIAPATRKAVLDYDPNSIAAAAYKRLAEEVSHELR
jgi:cellulose biosynthesis protein BcsQ